MQRVGRYVFYLLERRLRGWAHAKRQLRPNGHGGYWGVGCHMIIVRHWSSQWRRDWSGHHKLGYWNRLFRNRFLVKLKTLNKTVYLDVTTRPLNDNFTFFEIILSKSSILAHKLTNCRRNSKRAKRKLVHKRSTWLVLFLIRKSFNNVCYKFSSQN